MIIIMEKELSSIERLENLPGKAYFFLGLLSRSTHLDIEILVSFILAIYSAELDNESLHQIEAQLYNGNIGTAKEILNAKASSCMLCKKRSQNLIALNCCHYFHKNCLVTVLSEQIIQSMDPFCPTCQVMIFDYENIDPILGIKIFERDNYKLLESENIVKCGSCGNIMEIEFLEPYTCLFCQKLNCHKCQKEFDSCACSKRINS